MSKFQSSESRGRRLNTLSFLPRPRRISSTAGVCSLRGDVAVVCSGAEGVFAGQIARLAGAAAPGAGLRLASAGATGGAPHIALDYDPAQCLPAEGYRLTVEPTQIRVVASDDAGLRYGVGALVQILRQVTDAIPCGEIEDYPDVPIRGVMLYLGGRVFQEDTLLDLINRLGEWRVNHLLLEIEGVYAFERHPYANDHAKISGPQIERLYAYGRDRGVDIVILQNSFGHMNTFMAMPRYRHLAECPDATCRTDGEAWEPNPNTICPGDPRSIAFISELYDELFPRSASPWFHVGGDEPFDLGKGRSAEAVKRLGKGRVYLDFLKKLIREVERRGKRAMYWGDIVFETPEIIPDLPHSAVLVDWGYYPSYPFEEHAALLARHGIPFAYANAIQPLAQDGTWHSAANALQAGRPRGMRGMICTDWASGDVYAPTFLSYALTAAQAWCAESNTLEAALDGASRHLLGDESGHLARAFYQVGSLWSRMGPNITTGGLIEKFWRSPREQMIHPGVTSEGIALACDEVADLDATFRAARFLAPCSELMRAELDFFVRRLVFGCRRVRAMQEGRDGDPALRAEFARLYRGCGEDYRELWDRRVQPGAWKWEDEQATYQKRAEECER